MKNMDTSLRAAYGYRNVGVGHTPLTKWCGFLIMPPPMTKKAHGGLLRSRLLRSLVHQKRSMDYIALLFMEMVVTRHVLLSKMYLVSVNLLRSLNVWVTININLNKFVI